MKRTAVGLAAVAALGVAVVDPERRPVAGAADDHAGRRTRQSVKVVDLPPRGKSSAGDLVMSHLEPPERRGRTRGDREYLSCNLTGRARTFESANYECTGTHKLRDGTITFAGNVAAGRSARSRWP